MKEGVSASMKIDWIEAVFNSTGEVLTTRDLEEREGGGLEKRAGAKGDCQNICKIDGVKVQGVPELVNGGSVASA